jgi:hypothetical protein
MGIAAGLGGLLVIGGLILSLSELGIFSSKKTYVDNNYDSDSKVSQAVDVALKNDVEFGVFVVDLDNAQRITNAKLVKTHKMSLVSEFSDYYETGKSTNLSTAMEHITNENANPIAPGTLKNKDTSYAKATSPHY